MAIKLKKAVQSGSWSDPNTWSFGVKPQEGDTVAANGFTITIDEDVNVRNITTDPIYRYATNYVPRLTVLDQKNLIYSQQADWHSIQGPWNAFDGYYNTSGDYARPLYGLNQGEIWIGYQFDDPVVIDTYLFENYYSNNSIVTAKEWILQASNDGVNWTDLHTGVYDTVNALFINSSGNTTAYTYYRVFITDTTNLSNGPYIREICFYTKDYDYESTGVDGSFILNDNVTVTCTDEVLGLWGSSNTKHTLTYSGVTSATINANYLRNQSNSTSLSCIYHNGSGTLNIVGDSPWEGNSQFSDLTSETYTRYVERRGNRLRLDGTGATNIVGNIYWAGDNPRGSTGFVGVYINNGHTFNLTGNFEHEPGTTSTTWMSNVSGMEAYSSNINITGDMVVSGDTDRSNSSYYPVYIINCVVSITGQVLNKYFNGASDSSGYVYINGASRFDDTLTIIGVNKTETESYSLRVIGDGVIMSGPWVCGPYGALPYFLDSNRLRVLPTQGSYFVFADETNLINTFPYDTPGTTTLVSPGTLVDLPSEEDVRLGTTYGASAYTGSLSVPPTNRVSAGIPVDNTVGTAVLTPEDVWNAQTSAMNTDGSIGKRLKNAATVQSTGDQLSSSL